ncbi:argininosuccinate lyase [Helicobacter sp. MIT 03-1614]|uniref:argininosuccinate lyase n=1 Tax=Helicobacter sp. MIT 03-1614 TaxID=1548147 RepID=UPI0005143FC2|nr:argininosuccinate lyase [Helicobacter sp. MIT 03-1614]TLD90667.1 argininosuccinate lyase [Helicobacter sp. MIT 03-1614]
MAKLWGGRFELDSSALLEEFNASIFFDKQLWQEDIKGSKAHAKMLHKIGVLSEEETQEIINGLEIIAQRISRGEFVFNASDEDIHMAIESALTALIGDVGKKLHTARSRNDQVALDFRLYVLKSNKEIVNLLLELMASILAIAKVHTSTIMPGMTHLQHAQPINFGFALVAWACNFKRDVERLLSDYTRNNKCPLGSGALAGTPYGNDRIFLTQELGFDEPTLNAMDSVSDRDFALDMLYSLSMIMMHISRVAEELVLWSSSEFKFISLSDEYATGSSIMPQKKNPDVPELLRGKSGRVYGELMGLLCVMKGLPFAYNKDTQEDKEGVFDALKNVGLCLRILKECLKTMSIHPENMYKMAKIGHLSATDLADFLVRECGVAFRDAHHITGQVVAYAESKGVDISDLSEEEIMGVDSRIKQGVKAVLCLEYSMNARNTLGGTAVTQTCHQIEVLESFVREQMACLQVGRGKNE